MILLCLGLSAIWNLKSQSAMTQTWLMCCLPMQWGEIESGQVVSKKWNELNLMYIHHKQCGNSKKQLKRPFHCFKLCPLMERTIFDENLGNTNAFFSMVGDTWHWLLTHCRDLFMSLGKNVHVSRPPVTEFCLGAQRFVLFVKKRKAIEFWSPWC